MNMKVRSRIPEKLRCQAWVWAWEQVVVPKHTILAPRLLRWWFWCQKSFHMEATFLDRGFLTIQGTPFLTSMTGQGLKGTTSLFCSAWLSSRPGWFCVCLMLAPASHLTTGGTMSLHSYLRSVQQAPSPPSLASGAAEAQLASSPFHKPRDFFCSWISNPDTSHSHHGGTTCAIPCT